MKKTLAIILSLVLLLGLLAGCGAQKVDESKIIRVGASVTPHGEILRVVQEELEKQGYTLEIWEFTDYVQPNTATEDGEVDANYFQHQPYLDEFNAENKTHLVSVASIHYEPFGIYPGTKSSLDQVAEGDKIAVPNDSTNRARALLLLEEQGLIKLAAGVGISATVLDIEENPYKLEIVEMEAAQLTKTLDSVAYAVINGNYALAADMFVTSHALAAEDAASIASIAYANVLVVKEGNEATAKTKALISALKSDAVKDYINETYQGAVVPVK